MTPRKQGRTRACGRSEASARLKKAESYLRYAELALTDGEYDPAAGNAVVAAIAAADVICCVELGERSADDDHQAARRLVQRASRDAADALGRALGVKHKAHYDHQPATRNATTAAVRAARELVDLARGSLRR